LMPAWSRLTSTSQSARTGEEPGDQHAPSPTRPWCRPEHDAQITRAGRSAFGDGPWRNLRKRGSAFDGRGILAPMPSTLPWHGTITSVQPRIRLLRSFDERSHSYLGYVLGLEGELAGERRPFTVGIGKAAQAKHEFEVGVDVSGEAVPVAVPRTEPAGVAVRLPGAIMVLCHRRTGRRTRRRPCARDRPLASLGNAADATGGSGGSEATGSGT